MYDDAVIPNRGVYAAGPHQGHWYDEPPYESDPDDFLMTGLHPGPEATIQVTFYLRILIKTTPNTVFYIIKIQLKKRKFSKFFIISSYCSNVRLSVFLIENTLL